MAKVKYTLLLPTNYNDGSEVPDAVVDVMCDEIMDIADGWSIAGSVTGAYRMKDGSKKLDRSRVIWIGIEPDKEDALKRLVGLFAHRLQQESLYLERSAGTIDFITPIVEDNQP